MTPARPPEYQPPCDVLQPLIPPMAAQVAARLRALGDAPSVEACDQALTQLTGARALVLRLRHALRDEEDADG